ncbi:MAG TPA: acyl-CoA dehydrogenase family protein [Planctomycetes bacterium]|nr:acyl-CoA dehydrogenase family protein [Planctomycetota bacterium]
MKEPLKDLRERARALGKRIAPLLEDCTEEEAARRALSALSKEGLTAWTVPQRDGGADTGGLCEPDTVSVRALCVLREELAYHSAMLDVMLVMQGLGSFPVALGGSERLRADVLPGVASGEAVASFGLTEPGAGSSLGDVATRARATDEGWTLEGHKTFLSNIQMARFCTVLARTSGEPGDGDGLSMFFVPADAWGFEAEGFEVMSPHPIGDLFLKGCEVPREFLLGEEGGGLAIALATLARFRTSVAAAANGLARRALDESLSHLTTRSQFGRPLVRNQALRFELAEMDARLAAATLLVERAAERTDAGIDAARDVARAKLVATEHAGWIADRAVQHHGGLGVKRGTTVERIFREVRALRIYEGTSEIQKLILSKALLDDFETRGGQ